MKIWWCAEHGYQATEYAVNHSVEHLRQCWGTAYGEADGPWNSEEDYTPCRFVPMRLIPDNVRWFIERESGRRIAGPFTTEDDANYARTWVEKVLTPETFWIRLDGETP